MSDVSSLLPVIDRVLKDFYLPACVSQRVSDDGSDSVYEERRSEAERLDEKFFQALWNEQFFKPEMVLTDGSKLRVVFPGIWNLEAGPDFQRAVIEIDGETRRGDVEIHRYERDWRQHGHNEDANYQNVILHAVWDGYDTDNRQGLPPCFIIKDHLDRPWRSLSDEIRISTDYPYARQVGPGECSKYLKHVDAKKIRNMLRVGGMARFREKAGCLQRETIAKGGDQALYEGIFEALGYKNNSKSFRALSRHLPLEYIHGLDAREERLAAVFGASGLLPDVTQVSLNENMRALVKKLWRLWWPLGLTPIERDWKKSPGRPYNNPFRRLAAGFEVMERWEWKPARAIMKLVRTEVVGNVDARGIMKKLAGEMRFTSEWDKYADFDTALAKPASLLGEGRVNDILVNIILPFIWMQGDRNCEAAEELQNFAEAAFLTVPGLQSNRRVTEAAHRFFIPPSRLSELAKKAAEQQGMLALYRDFCMRSANNCEECPLAVPDLFEKLSF